MVKVKTQQFRIKTLLYLYENCIIPFEGNVISEIEFMLDNNLHIPILNWVENNNNRKIKMQSSRDEDILFTILNKSRNNRILSNKVINVQCFWVSSESDFIKIDDIIKKYNF